MSIKEWWDKNVTVRSTEIEELSTEIEELKAEFAAVAPGSVGTLGPELKSLLLPQPRGGFGSVQIKTEGERFTFDQQAGLANATATVRYGYACSNGRYQAGGSGSGGLQGFLSGSTAGPSYSELKAENERLKAEINDRSFKWEETLKHFSKEHKDGL